MERGKGLSKEGQAMVDRRTEVLAERAERLKSLGIADISVDLVIRKPKKRAIVPVPESKRVLRSRSAVAASHNNEDMLADQGEEDEGLGGSGDQETETSGRKRTRMHKVYDRATKPPVPVSFKEELLPGHINIWRWTRQRQRQRHRHKQESLPGGPLEWPPAVSNGIDKVNQHCKMLLIIARLDAAWNRWLRNILLLGVGDVLMHWMEYL